ncbi:MAG: hypothetical protein ABEJ96_03845 [Thiohalorhabdaceae bacterium]
MSLWKGLTVAALAALAGTAGAVTVPERTDSRSGAPVWKWEGDGMAVRAMGRPPDQALAFFIGRGFPDDAARRYASSCVFGMTLRNRAAGGPIRHDLAEWRVRTGDDVYPPLPEARWQQRWREMDVPERARTAFAWATFPTRETMGEGGYLMGMVAMGLDPGDRFDLVVRWHQGESDEQVILENLRCPRNPSTSE